MATTAGNDGLVKIGTNQVAEVRSWQVEETVPTIEDTAMGDTSKSYKTGIPTWSGSLDCWWDETDTTGQGALTIGATVTLNLYPEGAAVGDTYYTGQAIVTRITRQAERDGMVEASFEFQGTGALTETTV